VSSEFWWSANVAIERLALASEQCKHPPVSIFPGRQVRRASGFAGAAGKRVVPAGSAEAVGHAGEVTHAAALAAKLDRLFPEDTMVQKNALPRIRSIIEGQRGNAVKAVDLLAPITQFPNAPVFFHLAQAYAVASEHAKAAAEFEKVIVHRGWPEWEVFAPLAQLGLARTYAMQGERENSRKAYDDFFDTWKDEDPDIAIFRQAKAEYKKLVGTRSPSASASAKSSSPELF
jgi:eukaryotic-like serine/threonine-protein kinase